MKKILIIPDSFKGTIRSAGACDIMRQVVRYHYPEADIRALPVADGGEGSVDCFLTATGGQRVAVTVKGPYFEELESYYGILPDGTAVVEMAAAAGLPLVGDKLHPERTTTYGVGQLIEHAVKNGARKLILGLGGSATNDGGAGAAAALGMNFFDQSGNSFIPVGGTLGSIVRISDANLLPQLQETEITIMCDIDNPMCGPLGAAAMFGPQKGADVQMVEQLDEGLFHFAEVIERQFGVSILREAGSGAAGGMGGGFLAMFGARLRMGIETVLEVIDFDRLLEGADLVLTGEGKIDAQSLHGKAVIGIARHAKQAGVPVIVLTGEVGDTISEVYEQGVTGIFPINRKLLPQEQAFAITHKNLAFTVDDLMRTLKVFDR